jgi:hypothetical protein
MVAVGTYATVGETSVSSHRRYPPKLEPGRPGNRYFKETNVLILLPRLRRLSPRSRLAVGLTLTTIGLLLIIAALPDGVISAIVGAIFLVCVWRARQRERLTYPSR